VVGKWIYCPGIAGIAREEWGLRVLDAQSLDAVFADNLTGFQWTERLGTMINTRLDVNIARLSHLKWELELEATASGMGQTQRIPGHQDCELGRWLHSRGQRQIENRALLDQLMDWHRQFHHAGERIATHAQTHRDMTPQRVKLIDEPLVQLRLASRKIVSLLTQAELDHYGNEFKTPNSNQPIAGFLKRLFHGPHTADPEAAGILEINHARLVHLRWANHLPDTFRNRGRDVSLEPPELCALGVWIHGTGLKRFSQLPELSLCDQAHQSFHARALDILRNLRKHRDQHADRAYADVLNSSQEIIYLLSVIEYQLLGDAAIHRSTSLID